MAARRGRAWAAGLLLLGLAAGGCTSSAPADPAITPPVTTTPDRATPSVTTTPTEATPPATATPTDAPPSGEPTTPGPSAPPPEPAPSSSTPAAPTPTALPAQWWGTDLERVATDEPVVALTFDGGSSDAGLDRILAVLAREGVPATFFVTGRFARTYPDGVRAIAAAGHPVGNHSDTHLSYPDLRNAEIQADLAAAEESIAALTGRTTRPLFRFPFGARTDADIRVVNEAGYLPVRWTVDSLGWQGTSGGLSAAGVAERVLSTVVPGQIVLMHVGANPDDGTTLDADALPGIIAGLRERGYGFTDLARLGR